jgi:hypothetical protein
MALGTVDDIVARYSQNHRNVSIFTRAGVLNIVVTRAAGAFVPVSGLSLKGISVIDAFQRMVHAIDPSVPIGGVAEHRRYRVGDDPPADPSITMDVEPTTADNVLNSFVTQIPGSIWIVARSEDGANQGKDRLRVRLPSGMVLQAVMPVGVFRR